MPELDEKKRIIAYDTVNDPDENYYALIDNGTAGTGKVSIKGLGPADMISDQYSDSSTYKVGDLCIHNNKLYVCTVAINTPHAFNLSEWELDTLGNYASEIKQSLSDLGDATLLHTFTAVDTTGVTIDFTPYRTALVVVYDGTWGYMASSYYPIDLFLTAENHWARSQWGNSVVSGGVRYVNSKLQCLYLENGGLPAVVCRVYGLK